MINTVNREDVRRKGHVTEPWKSSRVSVGRQWAQGHARHREPHEQ